MNDNMSLIRALGEMRRDQSTSGKSSRTNLVKH